AHAASAVLNFSENCTPEILTPYLDGIVSKLLVLLQNGKQMVQEGALTALASVADSSQEHFQKYYDAVMPYLKALLVKATDKSNRMLRAKSMECISIVGMAVGKEKFRDDAKQKLRCRKMACLNAGRSLSTLLSLALTASSSFPSRSRLTVALLNKTPVFIPEATKILRLLLDIEDDAAWHTVEDEDAGAICTDLPKIDQPTVGASKEQRTQLQCN
ncbi:hypothetical protein Gotur_023242, partial [Gossypium turneri]